DNSSSTLYPAITNQAILNGTTNVYIGNLLLQKTPQNFWYDLDGNNLSDNVWTNGWDSENRMSSTENTTDVPTAVRAKETWSFDASAVQYSDFRRTAVSNEILVSQLRTDSGGLGFPRPDR